VLLIFSLVNTVYYVLDIIILKTRDISRCDTLFGVVSHVATFWYGKDVERLISSLVLL
jgi:hypothetical protein